MEQPSSVDWYREEEQAKKVWLVRKTDAVRKGALKGLSQGDLVQIEFDADALGPKKLDPQIRIEIVREQIRREHLDDAARSLLAQSPYMAIDVELHQSLAQLLAIRDHLDEAIAVTQRAMDRMRSAVEPGSWSRMPTAVMTLYEDVHSSLEYLLHLKMKRDERQPS